MDHSKLTKVELLNLLDQQLHLAAAVESKDIEISKLQQQLSKTELSIKEAKDEVIVTLNQQYEKEYKKLADSLAASQKAYNDLDQLRIAQLNEVIYSHGDLLKALQGVVDTHLKLNEYIVNKLSGGEK